MLEIGAGTPAQFDAQPSRRPGKRGRHAEQELAVIDAGVADGGSRGYTLKIVRNPVGRLGLGSKGREPGCSQAVSDEQTPGQHCSAVLILMLQLMLFPLRSIIADVCPTSPIKGLSVGTAPPTTLKPVPKPPGPRILGLYVPTTATAHPGAIVLLVCQDDLVLGLVEVPRTATATLLVSCREGCIRRTRATSLMLGLG